MEPIETPKFMNDTVMVGDKKVKVIFIIGGALVFIILSMVVLALFAPDDLIPTSALISNIGLSSDNTSNATLLSIFTPTTIITCSSVCSGSDWYCSPTYSQASDTPKPEADAYCATDGKCYCTNGNTDTTSTVSSTTTTTTTTTSPTTSVTTTVSTTLPVTTTILPCDAGGSCPVGQTCYMSECISTGNGEMTNCAGVPFLSYGKMPGGISCTFTINCQLTPPEDVPEQYLPLLVCCSDTGECGTYNFQ